MNKKIPLLFLVCGSLFAEKEFDPIFWSRIPLFNRIFDTSIERQAQFLRSSPNVKNEHIILYCQNVMRDPEEARKMYILAAAGLLIGYYGFKESLYNAVDMIGHGGALFVNIAKKIRAKYKQEDIPTHIFYHAEKMAGHAIYASVFGLVAYGAIKFALPPSAVIGIDWYYS